MIELEKVVNVVSDAIASSVILRMNHDSFSRVVEPYLLFPDEDRRTLLLAWQLSGGCISGISIGWKILRLSEITAVSALDELFIPVRRAEYPAQFHLRPA